MAPKKAAEASVAKGKKRALDVDSAAAPSKKTASNKTAETAAKKAKVQKPAAPAPAPATKAPKAKGASASPASTNSKAAKGKATATKAAPVKAAKAKAAASKASANESGSEDENEEEERAGRAAAKTTLKGLADLDVQVDGADSDDDQSDDSDDDDEGVGRDAPFVDVVKLPSSKDEKAVKARLDAVGKKRKREGASSKLKPGVLYVGRIPHGFFEDEMRSYFGQFGEVTRLRLSRNKRTGAPKHYGFIEFADHEVAQIVQETMDNYLIMGHLLQVKVIPPERVHADLFKGANRKWRRSAPQRRARAIHDQPRTKDEQAVVEKRLLDRQAKKRESLKKQGINYDFPGYEVVQ